MLKKLSIVLRSGKILELHKLLQVNKQKFVSSIIDSALCIKMRYKLTESNF